MNGYVLIALSSTCYGLALFLGCQWYLPILRNCLQKGIDRYLQRAGEIGFDENYLRHITFMVEVVTLMALTYFAVIYLEIVLALTIFGILFHLRSLLFEWLIESRERLLRAQTLSFTTGLMGLSRGGLGLAQAFDTMTIETPMPLRRQVIRITNEHRRGRPLEEAIDSVRVRLRLDAFSLLVTSITCALKQGASLEASLGGVQETLEHRAHAERQLFSKTSSSRMTILILSVTPAIFFLMFWFMMPESMNLIFLTSLGKKLIATVLVLLYGGIAWSRKLLKLS
jgi:tight adherence protein B